MARFWLRLQLRKFRSGPGYDGLNIWPKTGGQGAGSILVSSANKINSLKSQQRLRVASDDRRAPASDRAQRSRE